MRSIPGIARRWIQTFPEYRKTISVRCQKRLREEWQRSCLRNLAKRRVAFKRSLHARRISSEPTGSGSLRIRSGDIPEHEQIKLGTSWGLFPEWSTSWGKGFFEPIHTTLLPRRCLRQYHDYFNFKTERIRYRKLYQMYDVTKLALEKAYKNESIVLVIVRYALFFWNLWVRNCK